MIGRPMYRATTVLFNVTMDSRAVYMVSRCYNKLLLCAYTTVRDASAHPSHRQYAISYDGMSLCLLVSNRKMSILLWLCLSYRISSSDLLRKSFFNSSMTRVRQSSDTSWTDAVRRQRYFQWPMRKRSIQRKKTLYYAS